MIDLNEIEARKVKAAEDQAAATAKLATAIDKVAEAFMGTGILAMLSTVMEDKSTARAIDALPAVTDEVLATKKVWVNVVTKVKTAETTEAETTEAETTEAETTEAETPKVKAPKAAKTPKAAKESKEPDTFKSGAAVAEARKAPTIDEARRELKAYALREGNPAAMELIANLGAKSVTDLFEQKGDGGLAELVAACGGALND